MKKIDIIQNEALLKSAKENGFDEYDLASRLPMKKGGTLEANRKIVDSRAKILLDPVSAEDRAFDTAVAQIAKDNDVAIAFSLKSLLDSSGLDRIRLLRNMRFAAAICAKMKNNIIIISNASDDFELRDALSLQAFGELIGLTPAQAKWAMSEAYEGFV
ncbi:MAG: RNase P subunit p30 family protein [archaeon]